MEQGRAVNLRRQVSRSIDLELSSGRSFVVAILADTSGSTYQKAGARMIVRDDGSWTGMLSGGCLEPGIAESARRALADGKSCLLQYDTTDDADITLGTGLGCKGSLTIALIPLQDYEPGMSSQDFDARVSDGLRVLGLESPAGQRMPERRDLVVFGAGADAKPLCQWAADLDWNVLVVDPRPAYATAEHFPEVNQIYQTHLTREIADEIFHDRANPACVIIMTHNFNRDIEILKILSHYDLPYIGLLGPERRARDIMRSLTPRERRAVAPRLHAPMGFSLGGYGPEAIALATLAEAQSTRFNSAPQVRRYQSSQRKPDIVILAAGQSARMGSPKQLIHVNGETLLRRAVTTAMKTGADNIHVVVGASALAVKNELSDLPVEVIDNPDFHQGIASSIVAGIRSLPADSSAALIMTCDQPLITDQDLTRLISDFEKSLSPIAAMTYEGAVGVPAIFDVCVYPDLLTLQGDRGAKAVIARYADDVAKCPCSRAASDCDTPEDIVRIHSLIESGKGESAL
jgi:xanthine/CO dehydrogenase XdhC/CoxF family maturation factor/CTP:molybdopterin cytidylyltransferase MocA